MNNTSNYISLPAVRRKLEQGGFQLAILSKDERAAVIADGLEKSANDHKNKVDSCHERCD